MVKKKNIPVTPSPLFDTLNLVLEQYKSAFNHQTSVISDWLAQCKMTSNEYMLQDYKLVLNFLYSYRGSPDTFNSYRRELERLVQWSWLISNKSILQLKRTDIEEFIEFCQKPPESWIGTKTVARFLEDNGLRQPNPEWRPFNVKIPKKLFREGERADKVNFELSQDAIKQIFAILGSFFNYLIQEEATEVNPVLQIRQKSKFIRKHQQPHQIRRLSDAQWQAVLNTAQDLANADPDQHERTLFITSALYSMYLRISELASSKRWTPLMRHFFRDASGDWWFKTVGKGNKMRQIAVSPTMLSALKRWRIHLNLFGLPAPDEQNVLIPKQKGKGPIESTRAIRNIMQFCFDKAISRLMEEGSQEEAELLHAATVHWLRHTGISDDVKIRPREHVRDDAGHSSSAITDKYIDVELRERANSAKKKMPVE